MENKSLVKIKVTYKETGLPAVGYYIDLLELNTDSGEKVTDTDGNIEPFYLDLNNYIYADIFVRDSDDNIVAKADGQYPLIFPETIIHIQV